MMYPKSTSPGRWPRGSWTPHTLCWCRADRPGVIAAGRRVGLPLLQVAAALQARTTAPLLPHVQVQMVVHGRGEDVERVHPQGADGVLVVVEPLQQAAVDEEEEQVWPALEDDRGSVPDAHAERALLSTPAAGSLQSHGLPHPAAPRALGHHVQGGETRPPEGRSPEHHGDPIGALQGPAGLAAERQRERHARRGAASGPQQALRQEHTCPSLNSCCAQGQRLLAPGTEAACPVVLWQQVRVGPGGADPLPVGRAVQMVHAAIERIHKGHAGQCGYRQRVDVPHGVAYHEDEAVVREDCLQGEAALGHAA